MPTTSRNHRTVREITDTVWREAAAARRPSAGDRRITAGHLMQAASALEHAMSECAAAQHDINTSGLDADVWDVLELGREPEHMVAALRELARTIQEPAR